MDTFYCSHPFAETWFDWLAKVRFCTVCGCAESENGAHFTVSAEFVALRKFCVDSNQGRGVWKVIDEQRALLQHLQSAAPQVLSQCPWIEGWLARADMFLVNITRALGLPDSLPQAGLFPRPWPGNYELDYSIPARAASSVATSLGQCTGKHSAIGEIALKNLLRNSKMKKERIEDVFLKFQKTKLWICIVFIIANIAGYCLLYMYFRF